MNLPGLDSHNTLQASGLHPVHLMYPPYIHLDFAPPTTVSDL